MKTIPFNSIALLCLTQALSSLAAYAGTCQSQPNVQITFYGYDDNGPPIGPDNAFDCGRGLGPDGKPIAGGTGSFTDPISFATATENNNLPKCSIVYLPYLQKYFRNEDDCQQCSTDWSSGQKYHIDLWTGSNQHAGGKGLNDCETGITGGDQILIVNAKEGYPVDSTPLYDGTTCHKQTYPPGDTASLCSGSYSPGNAGTSPSGSPPSPTSAGDNGGGGGAPTSSAGGSGYGNGNGNGNGNNGAGSSTTFTTLTKSSGSASPSGHGTGYGAPLGTCAWKDHCIGAPCETYNDCDGMDICGPDKKCVALSSRF